MTIETIPQEARERGLWCLWKYETVGERRTKVPYSPLGGKANSANRATFTSFDKAAAAYQKGGYDGLGMGIFNGFCAVDIDHCIDNDAPGGSKLSGMAQDLIDTMDSYTEVSPSGTGIRILFKAKGFKFDRAKHYIKNSRLGLEVYIEGATNRYVTVTGMTWNNKPIAERGEQIAAVLDKYMHRQQQKPAEQPISRLNAPAYLQRGLDADKRLRALWDGHRDTTDESGNDLALFNKLAYWCSRDEALMIDAFLRSPYVAQKDEAHQKKARREDYLHSTAQMAIAGCQRTAADDDAEYQHKRAVRAFDSPQKARDTGTEKKRATIETTKQALHDLGITLRYNQLLKEAEVKGLPECYSFENAANVLPVYLMDYMKACGYTGVSQQTIDGFLNCIADQNRYNPVLELLGSAPWDGVDRLPEVYRILGVGTAKHQTYIRKWLLQCVALALNDEEHPIGAEGVLVLQGPQGLAKTSFFRILSPFPRWFVEGAVLDLKDKDTQLKALSGWLTELGELDSTLKREQSALKAFITSPEDRIRPPYGRTATRTPRRTSFCGTVNPDDYLRDETGSRRFWTVPVTVIDKKALFSLSRDWVNQLWFQAYRMYQENPNGFRLTDAEMKQLQEDNRAFEIPLPCEMEIKELLDFTLPVDQWEWWRAGELARYIDARDAVKVGKALRKIVKSFHPYAAPLYPTENSRLYDGRSEYLIPLKHFRGNLVEQSGEEVV